ncbi:hypothetical protein B0I35DRAFT_60477 [Stachybotrys elegans]|uniref:Uncharacterized protein n=1 Tax=Stachybotrys elegans TaxID=80388 RepID=A0A8K0WNN8_9HYPO|nr:hypothetical protein B0I35DRAFT_60477 [Stachybotrys elegans]
MVGAARALRALDDAAGDVQQPRRHSESESESELCCWPTGERVVPPRSKRTAAVMAATAAGDDALLMVVMSGLPSCIAVSIKAWAAAAAAARGRFLVPAPRREEVLVTVLPERRLRRGESMWCGREGGREGRVREVEQGKGAKRRRKQERQPDLRAWLVTRVSSYLFSASLSPLFFFLCLAGSVRVRTSCAVDGQHTKTWRNPSLDLARTDVVG